MGILKAVAGAVSGGLADQWLEVIEANEMGEGTVFTNGVKLHKNSKRNTNQKGTEHIISNGSIIHVYPNQFMMLIDGGKIVDYTAEEGYYKVDNSSAPSMFSGQLSEALMESFERIKYGGIPSQSQKVFFVNLQEIKGIKFGTRNPVNYYDNFYNAELFLRAHGAYSIKITDPIQFYNEVIPKNKERVQIEDINEQYLSEFLEAFQAAINQMSADGERISFVTSKGTQLSKYMSNTLDEDWKKARGMEVQSVGIAGISYDEESTKLINMRNQGAMMSDPNIREGFVQSSVAKGMQAAGSNPNGSGTAFMGLGMGMNAAGNFMGSASQTNLQQMQMQQQFQQQQVTESGAVGANIRATSDTWSCSCGTVNTGKFCTECGAKRPGELKCKCNKCGYQPDMNKPLPKFCPECGDPINAEDMQ